MKSLDKYQWCFRSCLSPLFRCVFVDISTFDITNIWGHRAVSFVFMLGTFGSAYGIIARDQYNFIPIFGPCVFAGAVQVP